MNINRKNSLTEVFDSFEKLKLNQVSKSFLNMQGDEFRENNSPVLNKITFSLNVSQVIGLAGRTGVGKTTLGRILGGLLKPDFGKVLLDNMNTANLSCNNHQLLRRWVRYVPQNPDAIVDEKATVRDVLSEATLYSRLSRLNRITWNETLTKSQMLEKDWMNRSVKDLSLGQRRRVINVRAFQSCPRFIIMDEPFNGLDVENKNITLTFLKKVFLFWGGAILLISHDIEALLNVCNQVWILDNGQLIRYEEFNS